MSQKNDTLRENLLQYLEAVQEDPENTDWLKELVGWLLQEMLELEFTEHLNAGRYERKEERKGYRNGYYTRELYTRVGGLTLRVPRDREGAFSTQLFERYQRSEKALVLALQESYLQGVSTRKVKKITEKLCGVSFSKDQVSRMAQALDGELGAWRERTLEKVYPYLIADARYQYVRVDGQVESEGILKVKGIDQNGYREVLSVSLAPGEEKASWDKVLSDLLDRGLDPRAVRLVVSDEHTGLKAALQRYLPKATWQRCQTHYQRNAGAKVPRKARKEIHAGLREVFNAPDHERARARAQQLIQEWGQRFPELTDWIEETIEDVLQVFTLPGEHQRRLRTTNSLERLHRESARRSRVVGIFPNPNSCLRLESALMMEQSEEWLTGHRYLTMKVLEEEPIALRIENPIPLKIPSG
jgi:putative transposase